MTDRSQREKIAYDNGSVYTISDYYHRRSRVFSYPNTQYHEQLFHTLLRKGAKDRRVLEVGCADGTQCEKVLQSGASYVLGIDVSERWISIAKKLEKPGRLEFKCQDANERINGTYDLIFGRSILHHVEFRSALLALYQNNLAYGGTMLFMEPLGENIIMQVFYSLAKSAHTTEDLSSQETFNGLKPIFLAQDSILSTAFP